QAMLLGLDREQRLAYILGDLLGLSGDDAAAVLEIEPAAYRKRLSRARMRLHDFLRAWCGIYDAANPCHCRAQVDAAIDRGMLVCGELDLSQQRAVARAAGEFDELVRVAEVLRSGRAYLAPGTLVESLRALIDSN